MSYIVLPVRAVHLSAAEAAELPEADITGDESESTNEEDLDPVGVRRLPMSFISPGHRKAETVATVMRKR